ncbi:MAG: hypothetical protein VB099_01205 [Candidatus Limiplasma sp.]|nr:hypothetical protein [Candidatus Limiplasma sp.]
MDLADSFDFDYYCNDFNEPGQYVQAQLLYSDIRGLRQNRLSSIINCQAQRAFDHAALPMYVMARALLQPELSFQALVQEFFYGTFGENCQWCQRYWIGSGLQTAPWGCGTRMRETLMHSMRP